MIVKSLSQLCLKSLFFLITITLMMDPTLYVMRLVPVSYESNIAHKPTYTFETPTQSPERCTAVISSTPTIIALAVETMPPELPARRYTEEEVIILARMGWGEFRGRPQEEWPPALWTVFQRADHPYRWGNTIKDVVTQPYQFIGYRSWQPVCPYIYAVVREELYKWVRGDDANVIPIRTNNTVFLF